MRKRSPPQSTQEIPSWFFTYSDVITLLMTFFIMLLTFSTSEPEKFEQMQVALFGGRGATGFAGPPQGALELDALVYRQRSRASRLTDRGSEMPPVHADPTYESLAAGLAALEDPQRENPGDAYAFEVPLAMLVNEDEELTALGHQRLRMLARRLRRGPNDVSLQVTNEADISKALVLAQHLVDREAVQPGKVGVGMLGNSRRGEHSLRILMTRYPVE